MRTARTCSSFKKKCGRVIASGVSSRAMTIDVTAVDWWWKLVKLNNRVQVDPDMWGSTKRELLSHESALGPSLRKPRLPSQWKISEPVPGASFQSTSVNLLFRKFCSSKTGILWTSRPKNTCDVIVIVLDSEIEYEPNPKSYLVHILSASKVELQLHK